MRLVRLLVFGAANSVSFLLFFFSSRRRHTRYIGDWSSDVCSSDLRYRRRSRASRRESTSCSEATGSRRRSEERRVGKECRSRWSPNQLKKNLYQKYLNINNNYFK